MRPKSKSEGSPKSAFSKELIPEERPREISNHPHRNTKELARGPAFHEKKEKNKKTNQGGSYLRKRKTYKKPQTRGDKIMKIRNIFLLVIALHSFLVYPLHAQDNFNQNKEKKESLGPKNGTLLIIGGAAQDIFYKKFMDLIGGPDKPIVVIPTATSSEDYSAEYLENFKESFIKKGFNNVTVVHTRDREEANQDKFTKPITEAVGVWFSGGRQWRHADSYLNTKTHQAFWDLLDRGGVIAGSSAGATIQGSYLARGDTKANTIMMGDHEVGLGFLSNVAIDQHLLARNRQFDMFEILDNKPELLGIGLDENTGIIVTGNKFKVFGESYVAIFDGTRWSAERDTIYQLKKGSHEFYLLKSGQEYDLKNRKVILN